MLNGKQYVGSSIVSLSGRVSDYFRPAYIRAQLARGNSAICGAILKYGISNFSLEVYTCPDPLVQEQYYLDNYELAYNIRRVATSPAPVPGLQPDMTGSNNSQFGKMGPDSGNWGNAHHGEQKTNWSLTRSVVYYLYSMETMEFHITCIGRIQIAEFFDIHINTAGRAVKAKVYNGYIISTTLLTPAEILSMKESLIVGVNSRIAKPIFIYNADQTTLLHRCNTVSMFTKLSGLGGSAVDTLCVSPILLWRGTYFITYDIIGAG